MRTDILIIDDDADIRLTLAELLQDEGYEVMTMESVDALSEILARAHPRVILLDLTLPGQNVAQTLAQARENALLSDTAILALSGLEDTEAVAAQLGLQGSIRKPFNLSELLERVEDAARREPGKSESFSGAHP